MSKFTFEATEQESAALKAFLAHHHETCGPSLATIGESHSIELTPTGLGTLMRVKCLLCHEKQTLTDYDNL